MFMSFFSSFSFIRSLGRAKGSFALALALAATVVEYGGNTGYELGVLRVCWPEHYKSYTRRPTGRECTSSAANDYRLVPYDNRR